MLVILFLSQGSAECFPLPSVERDRALPIPHLRLGSFNIVFSQLKRSVCHTDPCTHRKIHPHWRPASTELWKCLVFCRNVPIAPRLPSRCSCWSECTVTALCNCRFCFCPSPLYNNLLDIRVFLKDIPLVTTCSPCLFPFVFGTAGRVLWDTEGLETHQYLFLSPKFSQLDLLKSR